MPPRSHFVLWRYEIYPHIARERFVNERARVKSIRRDDDDDARKGNLNLHKLRVEQRSIRSACENAKTFIAAKNNASLLLMSRICLCDADAE